ncbi:hypothetical protein JAAARDRAFT_107252, partial [Jaapia argillacea MUCL 33604]
MPPHAVSNDVKARIPVLYFEQALSIQDICKYLGVRKSLVYKTLQYHRDFGVSVNPHSRPCGRLRVLTPTDLTFIRRVLSRRHCTYLDEIQLQLAVHRNVHVSIPTLVCTLRRMQFSSKKVSVKALEWNDKLRAHYMNMIARIAPDPEMLMFADEAAKDERTLSRRKGWSLIGSRCVQRRV